MLNIAARRADAHKIGRPHLSFDPDNQLSVLTWRPGKTLRTRGKSLTIPVLPSPESRALHAVQKLGGTVAQLQALGGHGSIAELQKYIQEIEQDEQAVSGMALVAAAQSKKRIGSD
jgi:hypothetical protein